MHRYAWVKDPIAAGFILRSGSRLVKGDGAMPGFVGKPRPSGKLSANDTNGSFMSDKEFSGCGGVWISEPPAFPCVQDSAWFVASTTAGCEGKEAGAIGMYAAEAAKRCAECYQATPWIPALGTGQFRPAVDKKLGFWRLQQSNVSR